MPRFFAGKLFMGAAAIGKQGVMQADAVLTASQRRFIERAEKVVLLVDSHKFDTSSGSIVCGLDEIDVVVTDNGVSAESLALLRDKGIEVVVAD